MPAFDLEPLLERDPRYPREAYDFLMEALSFTQRRLGRHPMADDPEQHVSARELLAGLRDHAVAEFGLLAPTVFRLWGIEGTGDIGNLVFNLIEIDALTGQPGDCREDFENVFDLRQELLRDFAIHLEDTSS